MAITIQTSKIKTDKYLSKKTNNKPVKKGK